jgi:uncharacterized membrane protein
MKKIKKTLICISIILIFLCLFVPKAFSQFFTINRFHSEIKISKDSSIIVKEMIDVEFHQLRRGIYRDIPFKYKDDFGNNIFTPIRILSVTDANGNPLKYRLSKVGYLVRLRIGDEKRYIKGLANYIITYKVENVILFFEDHDELYWNVTGHDWKAPIKDASATVFLEKENKSENIFVKGYEGIYGSKEECQYEVDGNIGRFFAKRSLSPGEGLTILFGWNKGIVLPPSSIKKFLWAINFEENWIFLIPVFSFFYMAIQWYFKGRDPKVKQSIPVMYEPPKFNNRPLTPAEVGTLLDERVDPRDISSTILDLAVKGYIRIEEIKKDGLILEKKDFYLKKLKEADSQLNSFEIELMNALFNNNSNETLVSELKNRFYKNLPLIRKKLYSELIKKNCFTRNPETVRNTYAILSILIFILTILFLGFLFPYLGWKTFISGLLTGLPIFFIGRVMPAKTRLGASVYIDILGFQEFMSRAEKDRIERMADQNLFSKFLPYAIVLDVVEKWSKAFEGIYQKEPDWYITSTGIRTFNPYLFSNSIHLMTTNLTSAIISAPRGSGGRGFSGGGFSGGGFGGGGGGSW